MLICLKWNKKSRNCKRNKNCKKNKNRFFCPYLTILNICSIDFWIWSLNRNRRKRSMISSDSSHCVSDVLGTFFYRCFDCLNAISAFFLRKKDVLLLNSQLENSNRKELAFRKRIQFSVSAIYSKESRFFLISTIACFS